MAIALAECIWHWGSRIYEISEAIAVDSKF